jgi:hypothetical protein
MGRGFVAAMQESELWEVAVMYDIPEDEDANTNESDCQPDEGFSAEAKPLSLSRVGSR